MIDSPESASSFSSDNSHRLGIVGLGHVSDYHLEALTAVPELQLVGACDVNVEKKAKLPAPVAFFSQPEKMFREVALDAVLVATPNHQHIAVAREALLHGLDVLIEKPATTSLAEFDELAELAHGAGRLLVVSFHAAFARDLLWFLDAYEQDLKPHLGPLEGFRCGFFDPYVSGSSIAPAAHSLGGSWIDSGINALSVVGRLIDPKRITVDTTIMTRVAALERQVIQSSVYLRFPREDGATGRGIIDTNWTLGLNCKMTELFYAGHEVVLHHSRQQVLLRELGGEESVIADFSGQCARLVAHYIGVFRDYASRLDTRQDNLRYSRLLHALLFSAANTPSGSVLCR